MKLYHRLIYPLYALFIVGVIIYSYVLIDPNLTLINHPFWTNARNILVNFGYYQRNTSSIIYLVIILLFIIFHKIFIKNYQKINIIKIIFPILLLALLSYPFLSHDFFNYIFDAKIFTFYHKNPYLFRPLDFSQDPWLRFMHWTHRTYPYGPSFLLITLLPSFISFGKFLINFVLFKLVVLIFYVLSVYYLSKMNKKWAVIFATSPLVIMEGLISSHNDLIGVCLAIMGIYFLFKKRAVLARLLLLLSGGIKYLTLPLLFITRDKKKINYLVFIVIILVLSYLSLSSEVQPWYFLALFAFLPFYEKLISDLNIFFAGLLFSYYPYIRFGEWGRQENVIMKHNIIIIFLIINLIYLLLRHLHLHYMLSFPRRRESNKQRAC